MKIPPMIPRQYSSASILLLLAASFVLTGCLSKPALNKQSFSFDLKPSFTTTEIKNNLVLGIRSLQITTPFEGRSLLYRTGESSYERDPYAEFLESPDEELLSAVRDWFNKNGNFEAVTETGSALKPDLVLEIQVRQLYGDFRLPKHPVAVVSIQFTFFDNSNGIPGKVIFGKEYSHQIPLSAPTAAALMAGWNNACSKILAEVSMDFNGVVANTSLK